LTCFASDYDILLLIDVQVDLHFLVDHT